MLVTCNRLQGTEWKRLSAYSLVSSALSPTEVTFSIGVVNAVLILLCLACGKVDSIWVMLHSEYL